MTEVFNPKIEIPPRANKSFQDNLLDLKLLLDKELKENAKIEENINLVKTKEEFEMELDRYRENSSVDRLTYLRNRNYLFQKGVEFFDEFENFDKGHKSLSVISLDVDFFKSYNEVSHTFGDVALQTIGKVLSKKLDGGFSVRLGGEEIFLVVEMDAKDIAKKADEIKKEISKELNNLIDTADAWDDSPKGTTRNFLETRILTENRSRSSFDLQMINNPEYQAALAKANEKYDLKNIFNVEEIKKIEPSNLALFIKEQEKSSDEAARATAKEIRRLIPLQVGTATFSAVEVTLDKDNQSKISLKDNADILLYFQLEGVPDKKLGKIDFHDMEYPEAYRNINEILADDQKTAQKIIARIKDARFGRIVDAANQLAEIQKKNKRDSVLDRKYSLKEVDEEKIVELQGKKDKLSVNEQIRGEYKDVYDELNEKLNQVKAPIVDIVYEKFLELARKEIFESAEHEKETQQAILKVQKMRYYDNLTKTKNYDFLTTIVPRELRRAIDAKQDYSVISFDMDNLKAINETGGHKFGDLALMNISLQFQNILENLDKKPTKSKSELVEKVLATGINPSLIRNGGGEEFIITLPGLNSHEAQELFVLMRDEVTKKMKKMYRKVDKEEEIVEYLSGPLKYQGKDLEKFGTMTTGILSLSDEQKYNLGVIDEKGRINAGMMREVADKIGERLKKEQFTQGESGRGHSWTYETFRLIDRIDKLDQTNQLLSHKVELLEHEREVLRQEIRDLHRQLKEATDQSNIIKLREEIAAKAELK